MRRVEAVFMSRPVLAAIVAVLVFEATVLLLGGLINDSWTGMRWALFLVGAWAVSMALGGSTPPRNRLGLVTVAGMLAFLAAEQIAAWAE